MKQIKIMKKMLKKDENEDNIVYGCLHITKQSRGSTQDKQNSNILQGDQLCNVAVYNF